VHHTAFFWEETELFASPPQKKIFYLETIFFIWCSFTKPKKKLSTYVIPVCNYLQSWHTRRFHFCPFCWVDLMSFHQNNTGPGMGNAVPAPVLSKKKHKKMSSTLPSTAMQQLIRTELEASHGTVFATYQSTPHENICAMDPSLISSVVTSAFIWCTQGRVRILQYTEMRVQPSQKNKYSQTARVMH